MDTHESYVSLEVAKLLKKAGFHWKVNSRWQQRWTSNPTDENFFLNPNLPYYEDTNESKYDSYLSAPYSDVAQRWLREEKNINIEVKILSITSGQLMWYAKIYYLQKHNGIYDQVEFIQHTEISYDSYEEALEAGMQKSLTILLEGWQDETRS